jgi:Dolichyl-phosphate-mannose-protein mannosyltransferase
MTRRWLKGPVNRWDHVVGAGIGSVYVVWLIVTARSLGFARDEGFYFRAGRQYSRWFDLLLARRREAFEQGTVDSIFSYNHEHPVLTKDLFGLSWEYLHEKWHVFSDASTAFRFPGMLWAGTCVWLVYLLGARAYGRRAGAIAAVLLGLMPRVFYHAHLACFDVPIMCMWTLSVYVYWRATQERTFGWAVLVGVVYGLTLLTKENAWMLPGVLVPHALVVYFRPFVRNLSVGRVMLPAQLVAMALIGPLVFYAGWPWLWGDPLGRVREWFEFHLNHEYYNMEFLGQNYNAAPSPRGYMPVMILATVPTVTLALAALGGYDRLRCLVLRAVAFVRAEVATLSRSKSGSSEGSVNAAPLAPARSSRDRTETDLLFFLAFAVPLSFFLLPRTPIFGGTKHWLPAYPFLAVFAGRGFVMTLAAMKRAFSKLPSRTLRIAEVALAVGLCIGPLAITAHSHPFGLSSYVPLVGGTAGGADLGLNRQFWGFTTESVAPWLDKNAPRHATIYLDDTTWETAQELQVEGRLRSDLRPAGSPSEADIALVQHELHMNEIDYELWIGDGTVAPAYVLTHDNVPIISVYRRK